MTREISLRFSDTNLADAKTEDLRAELAEAIGITARSLSYLATIWAELQRRGEDLSALRGGGLFAYLPAIAEGRLLPELVVRCAGQAMLLKNLGSLPIDDQRKAMEHGLRIAGTTNTGGVVERKVALEEVGVAEIRQAFGAGYLRPIAQQVTLLDSDRSKRNKPTGLRTITLRVTAAEHDAVLRAARAAGTRSPTWLVQKMRAAGIFSGDAD